MRNFEVKISTLLTAERNLNSSATQLVSLSRQITDITGRLSVSSSSISGIKRTLRSISNAASEEGRNLKGISAAASDIANIYKTTEQQIIRSGRNLANIQAEKAVATLLQYFTNSADLVGNVFDKLGLDDLFGSGTGGNAFSIFGKDGTIITSVDAEKWGAISIENINSILKWEGNANVFGNLDLDKGNINAEISGSISGSVGKAELEGQFGDVLNGSAYVALLTGAVEGKAGVQIADGWKIIPGLYANAKAGVQGITVGGDYTLGNEKYNFHGSQEGNIGFAEAEAKAFVGYLGQDTDGNTLYGAEATAGAEAYVFQGTAKGGLTIFGVDVDFGITGKALGGGVSVGGSVTNQGLDFSGSLGLVAGLGGNLSVDWTDFELPDFELPDFDLGWLGWNS